MIREQVEFNYFYFEGDTLKIVGRCSELPEDENLEFCKLDNAISYVQKLGCAGISQHSIRGEYHHLCLTVLRWAVDNLGETFPTILRGVRSERPDSDYKILFGTRDPEVAKFYGNKIKTYTNVRGLQAKAFTTKSVKSGDWGETDDEIIFFPLRDVDA